MWLESDRRPDISTWRATKWQWYDVSYCQCMNAAKLMCGWNQTGDLTSLPGGLPNGRDMTCLIVSVWMLPYWCMAGMRQETWHLYLEGCQMAKIWCVLLLDVNSWGYNNLDRICIHNTHYGHKGHGRQQTWPWPWHSLSKISCAIQFWVRWKEAIYMLR